MNGSVTKRLIKSGITNFFRNIWLSIAATSVMTITLFIISTILVLYFLSSIALINIKDKVGITAYFNDSVSEVEIQNIQSELQTMPQIKNIDYIPKNLALENFKERHKDDPLLAETLSEYGESENPLPASFSIRANNLQDYQTISDTLHSDRYASYFSKINDNDKVIKKLNSILNFLTKGGITLGLIFVLVTIMVMFNTIRLTIYNRREEVEIMRLVGATNSYIRGPFIIEGIMYGLLAMLISCVLIIGVLVIFAPRIAVALGLQPGDFTVLMRSEIWKVVLQNLVVGVGLGIVASTIAIRRYLKV